MSSSQLDAIPEDKRRILENIMTGEQGITQIGFGDNAKQLSPIIPMDISRHAILEEKEDEFSSHVFSDYQSNVRRMSVDSNNGSERRRSSVGLREDSMMGGNRKRRSDEMDHSMNRSTPNKRVCNLSRNNSRAMTPTRHPFGNLILNPSPNTANRRLFGENHTASPNPKMQSIATVTIASHSASDLNRLSPTNPSRGQQFYQMHFNKMQSEKSDLEGQLQAMEERLEREKHELQMQLHEMSDQLSQQQDVYEKYQTEQQRNNKARESLICLLRDKAKTEAVERREQLIRDNQLLGRVVESHEHGSAFKMTQVWEDGQLFVDLKKRKQTLLKEKSSLLEKKKELTKERKRRQKEKADSRSGSPVPLCSAMSATSIMAGSHSSASGITGISSSILAKDRMDEDDPFQQPSNKSFDPISAELDIIALRLAQVKRILNEISVEEQNMEYRKKLHIKFVRLMMEEKKSQFRELEPLHDRYLFLNVLGRGGFSEVYRAYDLVEHRQVACKVHQLNVQWSDERKKNYTKHATREYDIHRSLDHPRIVRLYDVFGIDINSFCTVLEYCDGMDLDIYLKMHKTLVEKEASSLMVQLFEGLAYLTAQPKPIIHYDLKPGNVLYKNGWIKLTDFGLAKIMEQNAHEMELTSQGAGTYWYLPPECFVMGSSPPMISPSVDIWSAGVILFQCLYGKRPFGDNVSQEKILESQMILRARKVDFPAKPNSSERVKQFIQECLSYDPRQRPSAQEILDCHTYFHTLRH